MRLARSTVTLQGFTVQPGGAVHVQALGSLGNSQRDPAATWVNVATTNAATSISATSGGQDYYAWTAQVPAIGPALWPTGGISRLRVRYGLAAAPRPTAATRSTIRAA